MSNNEGIAKINDIVVPFVYHMETSYEYLVDRERDAEGRLVQFAYGPGVKRSWELRTRPLPYDTAVAIESELINNYFMVDFWYDKLSSEEKIEAVVEIDHFERVEYPDREGGGWADDYIELRLTIIQV